MAFALLLLAAAAAADAPSAPGASLQRRKLKRGLTAATCAAGFYNSSLAANAAQYKPNSCIECKGGRYSDAGAKACADCDCGAATGFACAGAKPAGLKDAYNLLDGRKGPAGQACDVCGAGKFRAERAGATPPKCVQCVPGKFSATAADSKSGCVLLLVLVVLVLLLVLLLLVLLLFLLLLLLLVLLEDCCSC